MNHKLTAWLDVIISRHNIDCLTNILYVFVKYFDIFNWWSIFMMHKTGWLALIFQWYFSDNWFGHICQTIFWVSVSYSQVCWAFDQLYLVVALTAGLMGLKRRYLLGVADPTDHCWDHLGAILLRMFCLVLKFGWKCVFYFIPGHLITTFLHMAQQLCRILLYFIRNRMRAKWICLWFSVKIDKSLMKWSLDRVSVWNKSACLWGFRCDAATSIQDIYQIVMLNFVQHIYQLIKGSLQIKIQVNSEGKKKLWHYWSFVREAH